MKVLSRIFVLLLILLSVLFFLPCCEGGEETPVKPQTEEPTGTEDEGDDQSDDDGDDEGDDGDDQGDDDPPPTPPDNTAEIIEFADPEVKADIVAAFDTDEDGELSKEEAEAVNHDALAALTWTDALAVNTFDELQFFTGLVCDIVYNGVNDIRLPAIFTGCTNLTSVKLPANLTTMDSKAFQNCSSLESIELPESMRAIFGYTFEGSGLKEITIPDNVAAFSSGAFRSCASLEKVTFGDAPKLKTIGNQAFKDCVALKSFYLTSENIVESIGSQAFSGDKVMVLRSVSLKNVKSLGESAFYACAKLKTSIVINNTELKEIPSKAFMGCSSLTSVTLSPNLQTIGDYAFSGCKALTVTEDTFPEGLESIGDRAFRYCAGLKHVVLPSSLKSISVRAFESNDSNQIDMETLAVKASTPPTISGSASYSLFEATASIPQILVPAGSIEAYEAATGWKVYSGKFAALTESGSFTNKFGMPFTITADGRKILDDRYIELLEGEEPEGLWVPYNSVSIFNTSLVSDVPSETVIYKRCGERELKIIITRAVGATAPAPVVFIFHGGGWRTGTADSMVSRGKYLSKFAGVATVSVQYSMAGESGVESIEDTMEDCHAAVDYIRQHAAEHNIDASRMGFAGSSAGGHLASMLALTEPEAKVLVSWSGIYDMKAQLGYWVGGTNATVVAYFYDGDETKLRPYSPRYIVPDGGHLSAILFYGSCDASVHHTQAPAFTEALRAKGHTVQPEFYKYYTHSLCGSSDKGAECWQKSVNFIIDNI